MVGDKFQADTSSHSTLMWLPYSISAGVFWDIRLLTPLYQTLPISRWSQMLPKLAHVRISSKHISHFKHQTGGLRWKHPAIFHITAKKSLSRKGRCLELFTVYQMFNSFLSTFSEKPWKQPYGHEKNLLFWKTLFHRFK